jgi:glycosyltransferase involved in cell wall biosynthesis
VFVDGAATIPPYPINAEAAENRSVCLRIPKAGAYQNWLLAIWELFLRQPEADFYAMFQEDITLCRGVREYLESIPLPADGYLNLFCWPQNERLTTGFHVSSQRGLGALALVFPQSVLVSLLSSGHLVERMYGDRVRRNKYIDGAVITSLNKCGILEYVHSPSLVQHVQIESSLDPNKPHQQAPTFPGAKADARAYIPENPPATAPITSGLGLIGWNTPSGLGYLNRDLARFLPVDLWLCPRHSLFGELPDVPGVATMHCPRSYTQDVDRFLRSIDTLIMAEVAYIPTLIERAKRYRVRIILIPMLEYLPRALEGWQESVDFFLCPTEACFRYVSRFTSNCAYTPWPIDVERFEFRQRERCERFVFGHGSVGMWDRKGGRIVAEAARMAPQCPLTIVSQVGNERQCSGAWRDQADWPGHVEIVAEPDNARIYDHGDVCLQPSRWEGIGLQLLECQAAGAPLVTTDGPPMNEYQPLRLVGGGFSIRTPAEVITPVPRWIVSHNVSPDSLAGAMAELLEVDISEASRAARDFVEREHSWQGGAGGRVIDMVEERGRR